VQAIAAGNGEDVDSGGREDAAALGE